MASLHDIAPLEQRVLVPAGGGEQPVDVRGLSLHDVTRIVARFPDAVGAFSGGMRAEAILPAILRMGPDVIAAVIAAGCGAPDDEAAEKAVGSWPIGTQAEILAIVVRFTAPKGVGPFADLLKAAGLELPVLSTARSAANSGKASPKP